MSGPEFADLPWREIVDKAEWGIAIGNAGGDSLIYVNPAFAAMHGRTADDIVSVPIESVFSAAARWQVPAFVAEIKAKGHCRIESEHVRNNGETFPVLIDATTVRDANGSVAYFVVNVQDISERVAVDEALRISREYFKRLFADAPVAIAIADLSGRYISTNAAMCRMLGYSEDELLRLNYRDVTHPDDISSNDELRNQLIDSDLQSFQMEKRFVRKDGEVVWAITVVSNIKGPDGKTKVTLGQMVDIDRLKQSESALLASEAQLKDAQALAHVGSWVLDVPANRLTWSDQIFRLCEIDQDEFGADYQAFLDVVHPDDRDMVDNAYRLSLQTGRPYEITHRLLMADGRIKWVTEKCETEFGADGRPLRSIGTIQDVTERRIAEAKIEASVRAYHAILASTPDGFWIADANGRLVDVNARYCTLSGYTRDELLGMHISDLDVNETAGEIAAHIQRILAVGRARFETRHRRKDGSLWDVEISAIWDSVEDGTGYIFVRDISRRKAGEKALHDSRELLNNVIDTAPLRVFWKDNDLRYLGCNSAFARDAGRNSSDEIVGLDDHALAWAEYADSYRADDRQVIDQGIPKLDIEEVVTIADGKTIPVSTSKVPLRNPAGDIIGVLGIYQDISKVKLNEAEVLRSREQLRALAAHHEHMLEEDRKRIAHEIHDDLGQQLSALKLDVGLLRRKRGNDPEISDIVGQMRKLIDRSIATVRNVASNLHPSALNHGLVAAIEWLAGEFASRFGLDCEVDAIDGDVKLDEGLALIAFRVVQESLSNVARHARARRVTITIRVVGAAELHIVVRDDGCGFDVGSVSARNSYGLFGMRERVNSRGGTIVFQSRPGAGTTITVTLPLRTP